MTSSVVAPRGFTCDLWFDGERLRREPVTLRISDGRIAIVEPRIVVEPGVVDVRGRLLLPGLVNTHVHVARAGFFEADEPPLQIAQIVMNLSGALRAGVTTVADMGCTTPMLRALRRLTERDPLAGPRVVGAGPILTAPEGYPFDWVSPLWRHAEAVLAIDNEAVARRAVERTIEEGMDHVKVAIMHESFAREPMAALTVGDARAVVAEARAHGRRVYAHAHSLADYRVSLEAGVTGLMHSSFEPLGRDDIARIRDAGAWVCPTLFAYDGACQVGEHKIHQRPALQAHATRALRRSWQRFADAYDASGEVFPDESTVPRVRKAAAIEAMRVAATNLRLLADAGVKIVFGNDASFGVALLSRPIDELHAMRAAGMDTLSVLRAATGNAADCLGQADLGRLRAGAVADLLVADAALVDDLSALDLDRPGVELAVYARGLRVPSRLTPARLAAITAAYLDGTGRTLAGTLWRYGRSRVAQLQERV